MKKYLKLLSYIYLLMLMPQLLCSTVLSTGYLLPLYIICYSLSIIMLFIFINSNRVPAEKRIIKYAIIYFFILSLTFISDLFVGIDIVKNDLFDAIIKIVNIVFFMCVIPKLEIEPEDLKTFYSKIFIIGIISCFYNILINYRLILSFTSIVNSYEVNLSSFFANRNTYGMFLFISIFCGFYLVEYNKSNKKYYLGIGLLLFNLLLTMSRGSIIATVLFIFFNNYFNSKSSLKKTLSFFVIILVVCFAGAIFLKYNPYYNEMISRLFIRSNLGATGRGDLWQAGYRIAKNANIFNGVGFYTGLSLTNGYNQFHSFFIDNLVDTGLIGLLFKSLILVRIYNYISRNKNKKLLFLKNIYKSGFIGLLFLCFFESVNFFSLGFSETQFTLFFITLPSLIFIQGNSIQKIKE